MLEVLQDRNHRILRDLRVVVRLVASAEAVPELSPFRERLRELCTEIEARVQLNLRYLALGNEDILPDVLSNTATLVRAMQLISGRLVSPVLRSSPSDRLSLRTIGWLHQVHPETRDFPPAFSDGEVATWPMLGFGGPLYFFPAVEQRGLLYQPLYFHEFGHVLYAHHKPELDDLVGDLQLAISGALAPPSQRNDRHAAAQTSERQSIVSAWYPWTQELFCDAVALTLGGPCFLRAFSSYLGLLTESDFYQPAERLRHSTHPVSFLRVKFLLAHARRAGYDELAGMVEDEWTAVAQGLSVTEDFHGFYVDSLGPAIEKTIEDMLIEASPRTHTDTEAGGGSWSPDDSPVRLFNCAWQIYDQGQDEYEEWEQEAVRLMLGSETSPDSR